MGDPVSSINWEKTTRLISREKLSLNDLCEPFNKLKLNILYKDNIVKN